MADRRADEGPDDAPNYAPNDGVVKRAAPRCPICRKPTQADWRPFCSRRCADVDLGRWLGGRYAIPGDPVQPEPDTEDD